MKFILHNIQNGSSLKFIFAPVIFFIFFFMFIKTEDSYSIINEKDVISIPLQTYTLQKNKKKQNKISLEQIIEQGNGKQVAATDDIEEAYLGKVQSVVNAQKSYPPYESRLGVEDNVQIRIVILPNGRIKEFEILSKSKFGGFNDEVARMLHNSILPPFPQGLNKENIAIQFFIKFTLTENG